MVNMEQKDNRAVMPELLKKLLLRELMQNGFPGAVYLPESGKIQIPLDGHEHYPLITAKGGVLYDKEHSDIATDTLIPIAERVKEIVGAWNHSRDMPVSDLPEFRMLAEFNNIVLAARDDTELGYGLHFVTWEYTYDRTGVNRGHYTEDYGSAKEDFAVRAGLISKEKLFTPEQATVLVETVENRIADDFYISLATAQALKELAGKLNEAYPQTPDESLEPLQAMEAADSVTQLAYDINDMMRDFDQHGYEDEIALEDRPAFVDMIASALTNGDDYLDKIKEFFSYAVEYEFHGAAELFERFNAHLASMPQPEQAQAGRAEQENRDEAGVQGRVSEKPSIGDRLRAGKEKADANRAQNPAASPPKRTKEID
jgi:hypothetical protein